VRRPGRVGAVVAALVMVVAIGLGGVMLRGSSLTSWTGGAGSSSEREPASVGAADTQSSPEQEPERAASSGDVAPFRHQEAPEGSVSLGEPDPDAPLGPQPIPDAEIEPVRVRIPSIDVDSILEHLARDEQGVLQPPVVPEQAGWFAGGTVPGDRGPAVIAGHVDSGVAGAVFRDLDELEPGAEILVEMSDGEVLTFRVDRLEVFGQAQAQFPSVDVYGPVPDKQLRLITCHNFDPDNRRYVDNLVVFATAL